MEYLPHGDLAKYIRESPAEASAKARTLTIQLLRGLDILHKRNICHRDLKPPVNIPLPSTFIPYSLPHVTPTDPQRSLCASWHGRMSSS